jgi:hypothetical protein
MSGDRSKLPRWAQIAMACLEADLRSVTAERDAILQGADAVPRIEVGTGAGMRPHGYLPAEWRVRFAFGQSYGQSFEARLDGELLHLSTAGDSLVLRPAAPNLVYCEVAP